MRGRMRTVLIAVAVLTVVAPVTPATAGERAQLSTVDLSAAEEDLPLDGVTALRVRATLSNGRPADLGSAHITVTSSVPGMVTADLRGGRGVARAGTLGPGPTTLTASVTLDGVTVTDELPMRVLPRPARPYRRAYAQTLTMKMFLADNQGRVALTFEQALDVMRRVDNLTRGIPKIFYLVGWQYDGHDTGYPAWDVVNPKLKREQDASALDSLRWLIAEARTYHTTVSFHVNMLDASANSPLWQTYLDHDVIARNADGSLRTYVWGYPISYTLEWRAGLTQRRIDSLFDMVDMRRIGTVHVDAFHQYIPGYGTEPISPYHGITTDQEIETQKKIIRYWRDRGVDVTSEFTYSYRKDPLLGLQPMAWHFRNVDQMVIPPALHVGGKGGDPRFGTSMQGESIIRKDPAALPGFLDEFATTTLLWQHLNRLGRVSDTDGAVTFSDGTVSANIDGRLLVQRDDVVLRDGSDLFVPANWARHKEIVAYSGAGYEARTWVLPAQWRRVRQVDVYRISQEGPEFVARQPVDGSLTLSLPAGAAVSIVPAGTQLR
ncbi:endo-alpha-N-acetylgalactosaminidase family protein [Actinophytocola sp.]|uniref:endo-alpha-N-acetylgalactosaminidase family protein n=1 Tax=Actinophytocola sp. TaxID=1872138 RepID=UPI002ED0BF01